MDKFEILLSKARPAMLVLGDSQARSYSLIDFEAPDAVVREAAEAGMAFVGVVGLVDGHPQGEFAEPLDSGAMRALAETFLAYVAGKIEVACLENLLQLPDKRAN